MTEVVIDERALDNIAALLSPESRQQLQSILDALKNHPPPVSDSGFGPIDFIPFSLELCQSKLRSVLSRLAWLRQVNFLQEILKRSADRRAKQCEEENQTLREQVIELDKDKQRLTAQLHSLLGIKKRTSNKKPDGKAGKSDSAEKNVAKKKKRGAPKGHRGSTRTKPDKIDRIITIDPPSACPHCQHDIIIRSEDYVSKYIEDIPPIIKTVTENRYMQGACARCGEIVIDQRALHGPPVSIGPNLTAILTMMRQQMGASYRKLSRFSCEACQIPLTPSGVMGIINRVSEALTPVYRGIEASLPAQAVLHADETGWKMDGRRWYLWAFCNQRISFFHADKSRAATVPQSILGKGFKGLLHSDFYGGYNKFPYTQKCLVHYLRDIKAELEISPHDPALNIIKQSIQEIIESGQTLQKITNEQQKQEGKRDLEQILDAITQLTSDDKKVRTLIKRIVNYRDCLINFVDHPEAEFHNNLAERRIRPAVIFRKLSFGNRSEQGARLFSILMTVLETCRLKGDDLPQFIRMAITTPPDKILPLVNATLDTS